MFNWLYARHHGGQFLLRIEDTDKARSTQAAIDAILDGMRWLGLDWDGEAWFQSEFADRHAEVAQRAARRRPRLSLLDEPGGAGRAARGGAAPSAGRSASDSPWRDARPTGPPDAPFVVRLKAPQEGETVDRRPACRAASPSRMPSSTISCCSARTASPTYMLAVVVDDHDMGVTHVIRGDDHLNNAFRQLAIIRAMGWPEPVYAHVPLIHGPDGAKLSKRHGALGVDAYRDELGILPEALFNYLLRLGWGHGDDEIISRERGDRMVRPRRVSASRRRAST